MSRHVLSVCVFCFICATHSPCASHADIGNITKNGIDGSSSGPTTSTTTIASTTATTISNGGSSNTNRRSNSLGNDEEIDKEIFLRRILEKYGDGETMSVEGLDKLLGHLSDMRQFAAAAIGGLDEDHDNNKSNATCLTKGGATLFFRKTNNTTTASPPSPATATTNISRTTLEKACPAILYSLTADECIHLEHHKDGGGGGHQKYVRTTSLLTWIYSITAVVLISGCGVSALLIVPVMQKRYYKPLLQFLVALAVGTLAGDALLHLLPHSMMMGNSNNKVDDGLRHLSSYHHHQHNHNHHHNDDDHGNMWKGFVAMLGLVLFFIMERFVPLVYRWIKERRSKGHSHVKVLSGGVELQKVDDTKCVDKYNAYTRCYRDILNDPSTTFLDTNSKDVNNKEVWERKRLYYFDPKSEREEPPPRLTEDDSIDASTEPKPVVDGSKPDYTVILTQHGTNHHGHSHTHGHVHAAPKSLSSVAWMVIMGDGLHNFTDGMAIGAAFSSSVAGGFSTTLAVFCHELPHELGDFAMLLKAGMSIKEALCYNILSSVLCLMGNIVGIWLGNTDYASSWVFAVAAGTFIYIALVDMIPELSSAHEDEGDFVQSILHLSGLMLGFGVMTLIALFEHDLKHLFHE